MLSMNLGIRMKMCIRDSARTALVGDVAAFAGRQYEAVVVFDAAGNVSPDRPNLPQRCV